MNINSTMLVEELKDQIKSLYNSNVNIITPAGNIAGDRRKIRALCSASDVSLPIDINADNIDAFIRRCKNKLGLKITIQKQVDIPNNRSSENFNFSSILNGEFSHSSLKSEMHDVILPMFKERNYLKLIEFNQSLILFINQHPHYFWILQLCKSICDKISYEDEYDFIFELSQFGLMIDLNLLTIYFDERWDFENADAPFEQAKDFKWYTSTEDMDKKINGDTFLATVVKKAGKDFNSFDDPNTGEFLFNYGLSIFWVSANNWTNEKTSTLDGDDLVESLATMIWSAMESANWEDHELNEYTKNLPNILIKDIMGIDIDSYNSEDNDEYSDYRGYVIDWKNVCVEIHEGSGFSIDYFGPLGSELMDDNKLNEMIQSLTSTSEDRKLSNGNYFAKSDLPAEKMTIQDFILIKHLFKNEWSIPTSSELKEMFTFKEKTKLNFDPEGTYISSDDTSKILTGVLFFDDGEFDEREKLFAGKIRMVKKAL